MPKTYTTRIAFFFIQKFCYIFINRLSILIFFYEFITPIYQKTLKLWNNFLINFHFSKFWFKNNPIFVKLWLSINNSILIRKNIDDFIKRINIIYRFNSFLDGFTINIYFYIRREININKSYKTLKTIINIFIGNLIIFYLNLVFFVWKIYQFYITITSNYILFEITKVNFSSWLKLIILKCFFKKILFNFFNIFKFSIKISYYQI
jgi:hypothetical protein